MNGGRYEVTFKMFDFVDDRPSASHLTSGFHEDSEGPYGSLDSLNRCQSFIIADGLSGSLRVFSFVFAEFQSQWTKTCFCLSDLIFEDRWRSLTVFTDLSAMFPFSLSRSFPKLCDLQRPTYGNQSYLYAFAHYKLDYKTIDLRTLDLTLDFVRGKKHIKARVQYMIFL